MYNQWKGVISCSSLVFFFFLMAIESERDRTLKPKHKYKSCLSGCLYLIQRDIFINKMYNFFVLLREQRY